MRQAPVYTGSDKDTKAWADEVTEWLMRNVVSVDEGPVPFDYTLPTVQITTASNVTLGPGDVNSLFIVKNTAAIDFTLPVMSPGLWVEVLNDSGSTNDITVKDVDANTITTLTPGGAARITADITGVEGPL